MHFVLIELVLTRSMHHRGAVDGSGLMFGKWLQSAAKCKRETGTTEGREDHRILQFVSSCCKSEGVA